MSRAAKVFYGVLCAASLVLAGSGLGAFALGKAPMTHWVLMAHVAAAPFFALALAAVALTWPGLCEPGGKSPLNSPAKVLLWVVLAAGLVVTLSGVIPMTPLLGTRGQHIIYLTHRYSAMVLTASVLVHLSTLARGKPGG